MINDRGNLVKGIGQLAAVTSEGDTDVAIAEFTVTAIEANFQCTSEYADDAANGNFIAVTMDIQTAPEMAQEEYLTSLAFSPYDFKIISPDGTRENDSTGNAYSCLADGEGLPNDIGPGEHVTGKVVLDSAHTAGALILAPSFMGGPSGWEWAF